MLELSEKPRQKECLDTLTFHENAERQDVKIYFSCYDCSEKFAPLLFQIRFRKSLKQLHILAYCPSNVLIIISTRAILLEFFKIETLEHYKINAKAASTKP